MPWDSANKGYRESHARTAISDWVDSFDKSHKLCASPRQLSSTPHRFQSSWVFSFPPPSSIASWSGSLPGNWLLANLPEPSHRVLLSGCNGVVVLQGLKWARSSFGLIGRFSQLGGIWTWPLCLSRSLPTPPQRQRHQFYRCIFLFSGILGKGTLVSRLKGKGKNWVNFKGIERSNKERSRRWAP